MSKNIFLFYLEEKNMEKILIQAKKIQNELIKWRRALHQTPEIGMDIPNTAAFVLEKLIQMGYTPQSIVKNGIMATVGDAKKGKCVLLRADMDALPLLELADVDYASKNGNMHACGHDFHTVMLLGAAQLLKEQEASLDGCVKFMFQPGEETCKGAKEMLDAGILENPNVDAAIMIHVSTGMPIPSGTLLIPEAGPFTSAIDLFEILLKGKGGHGAMPESTVDPLNVMAHVYLSLQSIKARELAGDDNAVISVGIMHGGTAQNIIPESALLKGNIRTYDKNVRTLIKQRIKEISKYSAQTFQATAEVDVIEGCPSVYCNQTIIQAVKPCLCEAFGALVVGSEVIGGKKISGSEDFGFISEKVPSLIMMLSAGSIAEGYVSPLHNPKATFNEAVLSNGAAAYAISALALLEKK